MKKYTESDLLNENLNDEDISYILYDGKWEYIKILKNNKKMVGQPDEFWTYISKDYEIFWVPWIPILVLLIIMAINLLFGIFPQTYSLVLSGLSLLYISIIIPWLLSLKEKVRILFLDSYLENTLYHRSRFEETKKD